MMKIGICSVSRIESENVTKSGTLRSVKKRQQRKEKMVQSVSMRIIMTIDSQVPRKGRVSDGVVGMMGGRRKVTATAVKNAMTGPLPLSLASVIENERAKVEKEKRKVEKEIEEGKEQAGKKKAENEKEKVEKGTEEGKRQVENETKKIENEKEKKRK